MPSPASQSQLFAIPPVSLPQGFVFREDFITEDEERALLDYIETVELNTVKYHGYTARRRSRMFNYPHFGGTDPQPTKIDWPFDGLVKRVAKFADLPHTDIAKVLVIQYPKGSEMGWHRDAPIFGAQVVGISLASTARMRLRRGEKGDWETFTQELPPRSAYILSGPARSEWQHSIPATPDLRYSLTFRTLRDQ